MADIVLSPLLQVVFDRLASPLQETLGDVFGSKDIVEKLSFKLPMIQAVLEDAEEQEVTNKTLRIWLAKLKDAAQDAEDLLDQLDAEIEVFYNTGNELKRVLQVLDMTIEEGFNFNLREGGLSLSKNLVKSRQTGSLAIESEINGRGEDRERIVEFLFSVDSTTPRDASVIPIVGIGGLGKTTLAQLVYNDEKVSKYFDLKMWASVPDDFDVIKIIKAIIESATTSKCEYSEMDALQSRLRNLLLGKRYLLVLDDVWNDDHDEWDKLRPLFSGGVEGSKIIVTTRSIKVATIMGTTSPYHLKCLHEDDCWALFKRRAFGRGEEEEHPNLLPIGKQIVKKCGGVPLAATTLGSLMRLKRREREWLIVQNSELWNLSESQNGILPALRLSYTHLPSPLKRCFAFCSIFPKNYEIGKKKLIHLWIAEGFITPDGGSKQIEDIGDEYFNHLLWMSFFQEVRKCDDGSTTGYKMHDLIHDLARSIGGNEFMILGHDHAQSNLAWTRHASIVCDFMSSPYLEALYEAKHLRTLIFLFPGDISNAPPDLFSRFKYLRVLDLSGGGIMKLQPSIGDIICLRYLDLSNTLVEALPDSICKLHSLQTLNLSGCNNLMELPRKMSKMISLRHLNITGCGRLLQMPPSIGCLVHLQTLPIYIVNSNNGHSIVELSRLNIRGELKIKNLKTLSSAEEAREANLMKKENLDSLGLSWTIPPFKSTPFHSWNMPPSQGHYISASCEIRAEVILRSLQPHENLKNLLVSGYPGISFPEWKLPNLIVVKLVECRRFERLPTLGQLPFLKTLYLRGMVGVKQIGQEFYGEYSQRPFPSLKKLTLEDFPKLEDWSGMDGKEVFPNLGKLIISKCASLTTTPLFPSLQYLKLQECNPMILRSIENLTSLSILEIKTFIELSSIPGCLLNNNSLLTSLKISSCHKLSSLPSELESLGALKSLTIRWCGLLSYLPQGFQNLKALESLEISECHSLVSLPEAGIGGLSSLRTLSVENCSNLTSLSTGWQHLTFLEQLTIMYCPNLASLPEGLQQLSALRSLTILSCPKLLSLPEELQHVTRLQSLEIRSCPGLSTLPEWIENLSSLRSLAISDCHHLEFLPEGLQRLSALQHLSIQDCPHLQERCKQERGEDWWKIAHIPHKHIGSTEFTKYSTAGSSSR